MVDVRMRTLIPTVAMHEGLRKMITGGKIDCDTAILSWGMACRAPETDKFEKE